MSKSDILAAVKFSLSENKFCAAAQSYENPMKHAHADILEEYKTNQSNNKSIVLETQNLEQALKDVLKELGAKKVLLNSENSQLKSKLDSENYTLIDYDKSVDEMRDEIFDVDTSIVQARAGVANLGLVGLSSNPACGRLSSLVTNNCIYLLEKSRVVATIPEAINAIKAFEKTRSNSEILPSNIIFVAGPSRTADIELKTVFGVHGPRVTYVILY